MATILDKDLTRETTVKVNEREVQITLTEAQTISMKLKGMKSGVVEVPIETLFKQLSGIEDNKPKPISIITSEKKSTGNGPMLSLHDVRHRLNVAGFDYATTVKFDSLMRELIEENRKKQ